VFDEDHDGRNIGTGPVDHPEAVTFLAIGDSVIISPKRSGLEEARRRIRRIMKEADLTESALLEDFRKERDALCVEPKPRVRRGDLAVCMRLPCTLWCSWRTEWRVIASPRNRPGFGAS